MPDSGRTFSQKSLYEDLEDSFFRNIMAVYCEKESEKLLEEMKSSSEKPENLSPINKIYRKLHRSKNLAAAFRVAKKVTDRVALLVLAVVIIFAGAVTASAEVRSSVADFTSRWSAYKDLSGEPFDLGGSDIQNFTVNYATVWNFDSPGYTKLRGGEIVFGGMVAPTTSSYYIGYSYVNNDSTIDCTDNSYLITPLTNSELVVKGILSTNDMNNVIFYPYYNDNGDNLLMVCERTADYEESFEAATHLTLPDGTKAHVQPFNMFLALADDGENEGRYAFSLDDIRTGSSNFIEAEVTFDSIFVSGITHNENDPIYGTRAHGEILSFDDIKILNSY